MPEHDADSREVEAKFAVDADARDALLQFDEVAGFRVVGRKQKQQRDIYFDTAEGDLGKAGATLRVRRLADGALMTFKGAHAPAADAEEAHFASRVEDETPISAEDAAAISVERQLPETIDTSPLRRARLIATHGPLEPIAVLENERIVIDLANQAGERIELAVDRARGTRLRDGRVVEFDEVELESKSAGRDTLSRVARGLQRLVPGLHPSHETKLGRTLR